MIMARILIIIIYIAQIPCEYDQMCVTNKWLTVGYLHSVEEVNSGSLKINPSSGANKVVVVGGGFELGTSGLQVQCPTTRPHSPPPVSVSKLLLLVML